MKPLRIFLNGAAASAGGGLTYLRNVVPILSRRADIFTTIAMSSLLRNEFRSAGNISFIDLEFSSNSAVRFCQEQLRLPGMIRSAGSDVLISAGNFALRNSPVPQVLLSGNSLYTSQQFYRDLAKRSEYGMWLDTHIKGLLAFRSVAWADRTVAPSVAFARDLQKNTGREVLSIHHGFDGDIFFANESALSDDLQQKLKRNGDELRLLFVSHYNYYRNFETLLKAIPILREKLHPRAVRLFLTCKFEDASNPGSYRTRGAADLVRELGIADSVIQLGAVPYDLLHEVYRGCDIYVSPAYTETFAHPLVEAMSCGLPIVASDIPVHREICGEAALYFDTFSPDSLADAVIQASVPATQQRLSNARAEKLRAYSWDDHVDQLLNIARQLVS
jgi:glycosyltransferase involved in cell wall biosynthesis